ncbi:hypothetical protein KsCSTR_31610 [Candidatus Kuenenia stuttgartiensis]|uniref:Uncharacterized protein n=1 Tax=Kuenenia stuttgartiensis TaxID=174633 RepID=A0A6G7GSF1_KUEST|nr:hypothetical protein KsCSTR_31610 [Candidatus Kuenenia stuttgartiensis]
MRKSFAGFRFYFKYLIYMNLMLGKSLINIKKKLNYQQNYMPLFSKQT